MEAPDLSPRGLFPSLRHSLSPLGFHHLLRPPKSYVLVSHGQSQVTQERRSDFWNIAAKMHLSLAPWHCFSLPAVT